MIEATRGVVSIAAVALPCLLFVGGSIAPEDASLPVPRFEPGECPFEGGEWLQEEVKCGWLTVAENREDPDSRTLRLAVAVIGSRGESPAPDPLVFLSGGPGGASVKHTQARTESSFWNEHREDRDLVFFDQRGTGYSDPPFCPEMNVELTTVSYRGLSVEAERAARRRAIIACREKMEAEGLDFAGYSSVVSARDLDELRQLLKYEQWNLFGVSYGTRLALTAMRDTPEGIRSVILDSVSPPHLTHWLQQPGSFSGSLERVFEQCAADSVCSATYPDLRDRFYRLLADLEDQPMVLTMSDGERFPDGKIVVDGTLMADGFFQGLYSEHFIALLPLAVREVEKRNMDVLMALADGLAPEPHRINSGLLQSINCTEMRPLATAAEILAVRAGYPELAPWFERSGEHEHCDDWHHESAPADDIVPVVSDIPVLVLAGEFDPITPPSGARLAAGTLSGSTYIEAPALGHGVIPFTDCTRRIGLEFLDDPGKVPDTSCVSDLPAASFVTDVHVTPAFYRLSSLIQQGAGVMLTVGLAVIALLLLSAMVTWPLLALVRKLRGRSVASGGAPRLARWLAAVTALIVFALAGGLTRVLLQTLDENPMLLGFGAPGATAPLFLLPWILVVLTLLVLVLAAAAWRQRWWGAASRVHYTLIGVALAGFVFLLGRWGFF